MKRTVLVLVALTYAAVVTAWNWTSLSELAEAPDLFRRTLVGVSQTHAEIPREEILPGVPPDSNEGIVSVALGLADAQDAVSGVAKSSGMRLGRCRRDHDPVSLARSWPDDYRSRIHGDSGPRGTECALNYRGDTFGSVVMVEVKPGESLVEYSVGPDGYVSDELNY